MTTQASTQLTALRADIEEIWRCLDELFGSLGERDWQRKHGKDWVTADVPYHLAYFDREIVLKPVEQALAGAEGERRLLRNEDEINAWNAEQFARRPAGQSAEQSLTEWRETRERILALVAGMSEADLERPAWIPLVFGEQTVRVALTATLIHGWSEFTQLRIRLKRPGPLPRASATHRALDTFMHAMPMGLNREAAAEAPFTARFSIFGVGGGSWVLHAHDGVCDVSEDDDQPADITLAMSQEAFAKMWNNMQHPMVMMLTRQIRVKGLSKMGRFGKVFPTPGADTVLDASLVRL